MRLFIAILSPAQCYQAVLSMSPTSLPKPLRKLAYYIHFLKEYNELEASSTLTILHLQKMMKQYPKNFVQRMREMFKLNKAKRRKVPRLSV